MTDSQIIQLLWHLVLYVRSESNLSFSHFDFSKLISFCFLQPYCSLHLHLHVSENPYTSGNIVSKDSAPGVIIASGEGIIRFALWFAHPYCCLLSALILPLDHIPLHSQQITCLVLFPASSFSADNFTKGNGINLFYTSVLCYFNGKNNKNMFLCWLNKYLNFQKSNYIDLPV